MHTNIKSDHDALVIGAGPAGLMAATMLAQSGRTVAIADAMPSVGRKFLMAGKSGLNLTKDEPLAAFLDAYGPLPDVMKRALTAFGPAQVMDWAASLDQPLFTGSTGRVFPKAMKASPLLRAWLAQLTALGVTLDTRTRWMGWNEDGVLLQTPDRPYTCNPAVTVLALGGASWARLGSDGAWATILPDACAPFTPANFGLRVGWSTHMTRHFGSPIKSVAWMANGHLSRGEATISATGLEGGGIYAVSRAVREGAALSVDLMPDWTVDKIRAALSRPQGKTSLNNHLRKVLRLDPVRIALLMEWARPLPDNLTELIKALPVPHHGPRPLDEAISTAGGLRFDALDENLMLHNRPGTFCAGEMLDWEGPTGGYLITACLATGRLAGLAAAAYGRS